MKKVLLLMILGITFMLSSVVINANNTWVGFKTSSPDALNFNADLYHERIDNKVYLKMSVPYFDWVSEESKGNYLSIVHTDQNNYFRSPSETNHAYFNYKIGIPDLSYTNFAIDEKGSNGVITRKLDRETREFTHIEFMSYGEGFYLALRTNTGILTTYRISADSNLSFYFYKTTVEITSTYVYESNNIITNTNTYSVNDIVQAPQYDRTKYSYSRTIINGYLTTNQEDTIIRATGDNFIDIYYKPSTHAIAYFIEPSGKLLHVHYTAKGNVPTGPAELPYPPEDYQISPEIWDKPLNTIYVDTVYTLVYNYNGEIVEGWSDLPKTAGTIEDIDKSDFLSRVGVVDFSRLPNGNYNATIRYQNKNYLAQNISFSFLGEDPAKAYYYTDDNDDQFIWFLLTSAEKPTSYHIAANAWVIYNVNTGEYVRTSDVSIFGMPHVTGKTNVYVDLVIPYGVDDIVSVVMSWKYQYQWLIGESGWREVTNQTYTKGEKALINLPWYASGFGLYNKLLAVANPQFALEDVIEKKTATSTYQTNFVNYINKNKPATDTKIYTKGDIFVGNYNTYQIFLGAYNEFPARDVRVKDVVIINLRYIENGVEFSKPYPSIVIPDMPKFEGGLSFDQIKPKFNFFDFLSKLKFDFQNPITYVILGIVLVLVIVVLSFVVRFIEVAKTSAQIMLSPTGLIVIIGVALAIIIGVIFL